MILKTSEQYATQRPGTQVARVDGKPGHYVRTHHGKYRDTRTGREYTPKQMAGVPRKRTSQR